MPRNFNILRKRSQGSVSMLLGSDRFRSHEEQYWFRRDGFGSVDSVFFRYGNFRLVLRFCSFITIFFTCYGWAIQSIKNDLHKLLQRTTILDINL